MKNRRFVVTVARSVPFNFFYGLPKAHRYLRHKSEHSLEERTKLSYEIINHVRKCSLTTTRVRGLNRLPTEDGFVLYANHQGKYDALGILYALKDRPCSVLWAADTSDKPLAREICGLVDAVVIDLSSNRGKVKGIMEATALVKQGRNILIFPEGRYDDNRNNLLPFAHGCFACSIKTKTPIVPVCIYDSWKSMNSNALGPVSTQVHFLDPIYPEEYEGMSKAEVSELVEQRIADKLKKIEMQIAWKNKHR